MKRIPGKNKMNAGLSRSLKTIQFLFVCGDSTCVIVL